MKERNTVNELEKLKEENLVLNRLLSLIDDLTPEQIIDVDKAIEATKQKAIEGFVNKLFDIFANAMGICSGCVSQYDKVQNQIAKNFYLGEYKGFELAVKEVEELARQCGVKANE